jgi:hypothetical protein
MTNERDEETFLGRCVRRSRFRLVEKVGLDEVELIEKGELGVRVTFVDGERKFIEGEDGFSLYRIWKEAQNEPS